jgi:hypothetical protein
MSKAARATKPQSSPNANTDHTNEPPELFPDFVRSARPRLSWTTRSSPLLAAQDADEPAYGVGLPASAFHDLGQRGAICALHHRNDLGLLVGAVGFRLGGCLLGLAAFLRTLGSLDWFVRALRLRCIGRRLARVLAIDCVGAHVFSLPLFAAVTWIAPVGETASGVRIAQASIDPG